MAVFKITYFDIKYDGPELSELDTWMTGTGMAVRWCRQNNVCLVSITNICM